MQSYGQFLQCCCRRESSKTTDYLIPKQVNTVLKRKRLIRVEYPGYKGNRSLMIDDLSDYGVYVCRM